MSVKLHPNDKSEFVSDSLRAYIDIPYCDKREPIVHIATDGALLEIHNEYKVGCETVFTGDIVHSSYTDGLNISLDALFNDLIEHAADKWSGDSLQLLSLIFLLEKTTKKAKSVFSSLEPWQLEMEREERKEFFKSNVNRNYIEVSMGRFLAFQESIKCVGY